MRDLGVKKRILMVEDTGSIGALYKSYLNPLDVEVVIAETGEKALALFETGNEFALILLDIILPDCSGYEVLSTLRKRKIETPVVIMTAHGSIDVAVEAIRHGASDFLIKPCAADTLRITVSRAIKSLGPEREDEKSEYYRGFIGKSLPMQAVYRVIESAAPSKATVFITGESGTGKEICAGAIHQASSRRNGAFIAINCAAIPKDLIESELFGHIKGAFTGALAEREGAAELADGGTLFLDEICEMNLDLQSKLLRFIQTGSIQKVGSSKVKQVDVRFICATNRDPWKEVSKGHFREDLYYRLYVIPLTLPPLRERAEDVLDIAQSLLISFSKEEKKSFSSFTESVRSRLLSYYWPGNVRQLQNVIRNIVVLQDETEVTEEMLPFPLNEDSNENLELNQLGYIPEAGLLPKKGLLFSTEITSKKETKTKKEGIEALWMVEKRAIQTAIDACNGNIPQAAALLEVSPSTIYRKLQSWKD